MPAISKMLLEISLDMDNADFDSRSSIEGRSCTEVLPLQNGVDGMNTARSIVKSWGKGHPLVGWCNIVAAIQEHICFSAPTSNLLD